jgi:hypothetical protein
MDELDIFRFQCPKSKRSLRTRYRNRGKLRQCPGCNEAISVPDPEYSAPVEVIYDPEAERSLSIIAAQATHMLQILITRHRDAAVQLNMMLVYLPQEHEYSLRIPAVEEHVIKTEALCKSVNEVIQKYGTHHRDLWRQLLEKMQIFDTATHSSRRNIKPRRKWTIKIRKDVWNRFKRSCFYCKVRLETWRGEDMHLDHLDPLINDGADEIHNLVPSCPGCNLEKGGKYFNELKAPKDL